MPIRIRVFLIITSIVAVITASSIIFSLFFTQSQIIKTMESDLVLAVELADSLVTNRVNLLKANASKAAYSLADVGAGELHAFLAAETDADLFFTGLALFDEAGNLAASTGNAPAQISEEGRAALAGGKVGITSTAGDPAGGIVFHLWAPVEGGRLLGLTIPGLLFSDLFSGLRIWKTGSFILLDRDGVIIASRYTDRVEKRMKFVESGETAVEKASMAAFYALATGGGEGVGNYTLFGAPRICAYAPVRGADVDWYIGAAAPIRESPVSHLRRTLSMAAVLFFGFGLIAAFLASSFISKPFTRIQEQNQKLEELTELAQNSSQAKSRFLANMSHEMRTPLNAIIGLSELTLREKNLFPSAESNIEKVYGSGMTILGIVNDLLDISKIESGKFELIPAEYDVPSLINDTINTNIIRIGSKPIAFKLLVDETLPGRLCGDELRVKQIFNNLLSNAFKYTHEGSVILRISCQEEDGAAWLTASVKDTGIGIRAEDRDKLFADFNRLDERKNRYLEGTGLGLALTKNMAELMDGTVTVESEYGKGSTFTVRLRQKPVDAPPIGAKVAADLTSFRYSIQKRSHNERFARIRLPYARVLVVDDVPINLDVAKGMLAPYGMQIDCVSSGEEAIRLIRKHEVHYDAVFMDHMMPEMDGVEATRIIKEQIGTDYARHIPVIMLTANAIAGNREMFLALGFNDFLSKPIDIMRLDAVVHRWIRDKSREEPDEETPASAAAAPLAAPLPAMPGMPAAAPAEGGADFLSWNIDGLYLDRALERFSGEDWALIGALRSWIKHIPGLLDTLRDVPETAGGDALEKYFIAAHSVKGSSYGIGAEAIGDRAAGLEKAAREKDLAYIAAHAAAFVADTEKTAAALSARMIELGR